MAEKKIVYFEQPGRENTGECLNLVRQAVQTDGYRHLVIASTTGETGLLFSTALKDLGLNIVVVTHSMGFKEPNKIEMPAEVRKAIEDNGARVFTGSLLTHSLDAAFSTKLSGFSLAQIIAQALRRFGQGAKVGCECVMMTVDAGLVPEGEEVLSVAGTARGSDSVLLIRSSASKRFFSLNVLEILAKPRG